MGTVNFYLFLVEVRKKWYDPKQPFILRNVLLWWIPFAFMLSGCKTDTKKQDTLFKLLSSKDTGITFSNDISQNDTLNVLTYMYFYNGGGVGLGDINNDGFTDIFFSGNMVSSRLYLNKGNHGSAPFQFEDITEKAGIATKSWCTGVAMVDINNDGFLDIYVSRGR